MTITPSETVLKYKPWSVSKANTAKQCPKKFWYEYIDKTKKKVSNSDAAVGSAVHKLLEVLMTGRPWKLAMAAVLDEGKLTTPEIERVMELQCNTESFMRRFEAVQKKYEITKVIKEQRLSVTLEGQPIEFFNNNGYMRGVVDLAFLRAIPQAIIIDHKTGKPKDLKYYQDTFDTYALLLKAAYPHLQLARCGIHFVASEEITFIPDADISDISVLMDKVTLFLNNATQNLTDFTIEKKSRLCEWCDYRVYCPTYIGSNSDNGNQESSRQT